MEKRKTGVELELHEDIIVGEILPRLPVKSLLRFKSVCKEWESLISNSHHFAKLQLHFQRTSINYHDSKYCLVREHSTRSDTPCICCGNRLLSLKFKHEPVLSLKLQHEPEVVGVDIAEMKKLPTPATVVGSSNGLICLNHEVCTKNIQATLITRITRRFELCNPATGKRWLIPAPPRLLNHHDICEGFGYISSLDDYKIVVLKSRTYPIINIDYTLTYSCSTNAWKQIEQTDKYGYKDDLQRRKGCGIQVGESLHWGLNLRAGRNPAHPIVLAFNLARDLIQWLRVSLPDGPEWPLPRYYLILKDKEHLCVRWPNQKYGMAILMLDDDGSNWKQVFTFEDAHFFHKKCRFSDTQSRVGIANHGQILAYMSVPPSGQKYQTLVQQFDTPDPVLWVIQSEYHIQTLVTPFTSQRRPTTISTIIVDPQ